MQPTTSAQKNGGKPAPAAVKPDAKPDARVVTDEAASGTAAKPEAVEAAPVPQLSPEEKRRYFDAVLAAEAEIRAAEQRVKDARLACSGKVKDLIAAMGGKHGPWRYKGELLRARVRNDLAYFLRPDDLDVEDI
jgi:hypothetical protein